MTTRDTHELEEAGQKLGLDVLKASLNINGGEPDNKKPVCLQRIGNKVLEIGLRDFLEGLSPKCIEESCKAAKLSIGKRSKDITTKLGNAILQQNLDEFLQECSKDLLSQYCTVLLLDQSTKENMIAQIADEIMLTGSKKFLHTLTLPLLKKWCTSMGQKTQGTKKDLVERLMVHIFELEPLVEENVPEEQEDEEEEEEEEEAPRKKTKTTKRTSKKEVPVSLNYCLT